MTYIKPAISVSSLQLHLDTQYGIFFTPEGCPSYNGIVSTPGAGLSENSIFICVEDIFSLDDIKNDPPNIIFSFTCANLQGVFHTVPDFSQAELGDISCSSGSYSIAIPYEISPELPENCNIDTLTIDDIDDNFCDE
jgi:hypothetical protein